ncbi:MAG: hypothetical protein K9G34_01790 [Melioribacteraceae bacterium]|nr:hypothetical protein [Melioribacteraceae bacterium]
MNLVFLSIFLTSSSCGQKIPAPIENNNFERVSTHGELMDYLQRLSDANTFLELEIIGKSVEGRDIPMIYKPGVEGSESVKALIFCQQHGNEPSGKEAALLVIKKISEDPDLYSNVDLYIIPSVNPDGNESEKRRNANGEDLNRNHLLLTEPEVQAVHNVYHKINPEVTLDVHEYSAFRKSFRQAGFVRSTAEELGAPTNLNIPDQIITYAVDSLMAFVENDLISKNVSFSNYHKIGDPLDTVRSSTTGIIDGRQSMAIENTLSFILEGRNGESFNSDLERRTLDQLSAMESFLSFVNSRGSNIKKIIKAQKEVTASSLDSVIIQMDYDFTGETINIPMQVLTSLRDTLVEMKYSSTVKSLKKVPVPEAYLVSGEIELIVEWLDRNKIQYQQVNESSSFLIERYSIENVKNRWIENKSFRIPSIAKSKKIYKTKLNDIIIPINQIAGVKIISAFEPQSMWGLFQSDLFQNVFEGQTEFPIYRIISEYKNEKL